MPAENVEKALAACRAFAARRSSLIVESLRLAARARRRRAARHRLVRMTQGPESGVRRARDIEDLGHYAELVASAKARLPAAAWDFIVGGAETETTILRQPFGRSTHRVFARDAARRRRHPTSRSLSSNPSSACPSCWRRLASLADIHPDGALPIAARSKDSAA